jgi:hypothetical protein
MIAARVRGPLAPRAQHVTGAVEVGAKKGAASLDAFRLTRFLGSKLSAWTGPARLTARRRRVPAAHRRRVDTSRCTIPRRCRRHRAGRSHWRETRRRGRCRQSRRPSSWRAGSRPPRCWHRPVSRAEVVAPRLGPPARPPRAANSHSASVGRRFPASRRRTSARSRRRGRRAGPCSPSKILRPESTPSRLAQLSAPGRGFPASGPKPPNPLAAARPASMRRYKARRGVATKSTKKQKGRARGAPLNGRTVPM